MFHRDIIIQDGNSLCLDILSMPVLDSRMYLISASGSTSGRDNSNQDLSIGVERTGPELLIIDPVYIADDDIQHLESACSDFDHATVLLTHSHYDHIAGIEKLRTIIPTTVYATSLCDEKLKSPQKNLSAYSMALVMGKSEEERQYCERFFDFEYKTHADEIYDGELCLDFDSFYIRTVQTPGHSDCSQCIELWTQADSDRLIAVFTGDSLVNGHEVITRFPSGSKKVFKEETDPYLYSLDDELQIFPGHGEPDTLGSLRQYLI